MRKTTIIAILACASFTLSGIVASQAMVFSAPAQQNSSFVFKNHITQASVECKVNWVNGACGTPEQVRNNNGGGTPNTYPTAPQNPCAGRLIVSTDCFSNCCF